MGLSKLVKMGTPQQRVCPDQLCEQICEARLVAVIGLLNRPGSEAQTNTRVMEAATWLMYRAPKAVTKNLGTYLGLLLKILERQALNPVNPEFNHQLFESIACIISKVTQNEQAKGIILQQAMKLLQLSEKCPEFAQYAYQLLAQVLFSYGKKTPDGFFKTLFPQLLNKEAWKLSGNVNAICKLLEIYFQKEDLSTYVKSDIVVSLLQIFEHLLRNRAHDAYSFLIPTALVKHFPLDSYKAHLTTILKLVFTRVSDIKFKTNVFCQNFVGWAGDLMLKHGFEILWASLDQFVQSGKAAVLFPTLCKKYFTYYPLQIGTKGERLRFAVRLTPILKQASLLQQKPFQEAYVQTLQVAIVLITEQAKAIASQDLIGRLEDQGYDSHFARLHHALMPQVRSTSSQLEAERAFLAAIASIKGFSNVMQQLWGSDPKKKKKYLDKVVAIHAKHAQLGARK